ncbi:MAG: hypothetical protein M3522_05945, partial [Actinomycetota bacterium]|nr:hypothetical protein [Actinomycetota bacterium]
GLEVEVYEADWDALGTKAGPIRNERMLSLPGIEDLSAFRAKGRSLGTDGAVRLAKSFGIRGSLTREK